MNVLWETMIDEMRAVRFELDARRHFTEENRPIEMTRELIDKWTNPAPAVDLQVVSSRTAMALRRAADKNLIEVG